MSFKELDKMLLKEVPIDYWEDELVIIAQELVESLKEEDWKQMIKVMKSKNSEWKRRLSQVIDEAEENKFALDILLILMEDEDIMVSIAAIDSLRVVIQYNDYVFSDFQKNIIDNIIDRGGVYSRIAKELKKKVGLL